MALITQNTFLIFALQAVFGVKMSIYRNNIIIISKNLHIILSGKNGPHPIYISYLNSKLANIG